MLADRCTHVTVWGERDITDSFKFGTVLGTLAKSESPCAHPHPEEQRQLVISVVLLNLIMTERGWRAAQLQLKEQVSAILSQVPQTML